MKILLIYLKPKDGLDLVDAALKEIPCDKLILKYFPYPTVYKIALATIKGHSEYTHIIWVQNDIVFNLKDYNQLLTSYTSTGEHILGCSMNVDLNSNKELLAYTVETFEYSLNKTIPFVKKGTHEGIIRVYHNGGVFIAQRDFLIQFPLIGFGKSGYNADIEQGQKIYNAGQNYLLNTDINLLHLRFEGVNQVGIKKPGVEFVRA